MKKYKYSNGGKFGFYLTECQVVGMNLCVVVVVVIVVVVVVVDSMGEEISYIISSKIMN
jgi:hypothetical protein